jgi:replicative DNA helicase
MSSRCVEPGDFYEPKHEAVYEAIGSLVRRSVAVDAISVADELGRMGELQRMGGAAWVHELAGVPTSPAAAVHHAEIVKGLAVRRRMVEVGQRIAGMGFSSEGDVHELVELARADVDRVAGGQQVEVKPIGASMDDVLEQLEQKPTLIPTPWSELNEVLVGLQPGRFYVVAARPGEGKSMVGLQLAVELCRRGPVAFSSLEMSREEILLRLLSSRAGVHMGSIERSSLSEEEWRQVAVARPEITALPLHVDDRGDVTITQIRAHARSVSRRGRLSGVVVDYLQLVSGIKGAERYAVVSDITRQLKIMAKDLQVPVIALSQLNRGPEGPNGKRRAPALSDLRESGTIEQDADVVILLQRELENDDKPGDRIRMHVAKNRHGKTGYRTLRWNGAHARVDSWNRYGLGELPVPD